MIRQAAVILADRLDQYGERQAQVLDHLVVRAVEIAPDKRIPVALAMGQVAQRWAKARQSGWENTEEDRAIAFVSSLAREDQHSPSIQTFLERLIADSESLMFSSDVTTFTDPDRNHILDSWDNVDRERLDTPYRTQLSLDGRNAKAREISVSRRCSSIQGCRGRPPAATCGAGRVTGVPGACEMGQRSPGPEVRWADLRRLPGPGGCWMRAA